MFTGIIEHVGCIDSLEASSDGARLRAHAGPLAASLAVAGSVAVNGCCLTVVALDGETFTADLSAETLRRTTFASAKAGARVNLERPLTAGKELGGHFVQGHVDGMGRIARLDAEGPNWWLGVQLPPELALYVAMKGSIAIDGISLTVAAIHDGIPRPQGGCIIEAAIIPFTYANTNLQTLAPGDAVNLETDILAKYVERLLHSRRAATISSLTVERLMEEGF
jgi:riboflavin synthase